MALVLRSTLAGGTRTPEPSQWEGKNTWIGQQQGRRGRGGEEEERRGGEDRNSHESPARPPLSFKDTLATGTTGKQTYRERSPAGLDRRQRRRRQPTIVSMGGDHDLHPPAVLLVLLHGLVFPGTAAADGGSFAADWRRLLFSSVHPSTRSSVRPLPIHPVHGARRLAASLVRLKQDYILTIGYVTCMDYIPFITYNREPQPAAPPSRQNPPIHPSPPWQSWSGQAARGGVPRPTSTSTTTTTTSYQDRVGRTGKDGPGATRIHPPWSLLPIALCCSSSFPLSFCCCGAGPMTGARRSRPS